MELVDEPGRPHDALVGIVGWAQEANCALEIQLRELGIAAELLSPSGAMSRLAAGDTALGRIDVLPTLDGVQPGLDALTALGTRGVRVLNRPRALLNAHDKLRTLHCLRDGSIPHPRTRHVVAGAETDDIALPAVVKPRFGSWGADVFLCRTRAELGALLRHLAGKPWFRRQGALVQDFVPNPGRDLRILVAGGRAIGAVERIAQPGEWRSNISLGADRRPVTPSSDARDLAERTAQALGIDLVGVDLLPSETRGFVVLEANGAVEFEATYSFPGTGVYRLLADALSLPQAAPVGVAT